MPLAPRDGTVLVVDDDVDTRAVLRIALEEVGFTVDSAGDGLSALRKIREQTPAAVILDLNMPRMGGEDFLYAWRAGVETPGVPTIVISAAYKALRPEDLGVEAVFAKPFDIAKLVECVAGLVESSAPVFVTASRDARTTELREVAESLAQAMSVIVGNVELLEDAPPDPAARRATMVRAMDAAHRGSALVRRLSRLISTLD